MNEEKVFLFAGPPQRLDRFLAERLAPLSRTRIQRLINEGGVTVNGRRLPARHPLQPGETVTARLPSFSSLPSAAAESVPILYEDDDILVVDKPAGLVVHPAGPHRTDTLIQRLWPKLAEGWAQNPTDRGDRPGVVHRLDKGTSGVMIIAKNPTAAQHLSQQFADRRVKKTYLAMVQGIVAQEGRIRSMVGRSRRSPQKMSTETGRWSELEFSVVKAFPASVPPQTLLEVRPKTGRTHQIRVQLAALGHPLIGDPLYGGPDGPHPQLHAWKITFHHPTRETLLSFTSPLPNPLWKS